MATIASYASINRTTKSLIISNHPNARAVRYVVEWAHPGTLDIVRFRGTPQTNEATIKQTAELDKIGVDVWMEQEPGSSGVNDIDHYARQVLLGFTFRPEKTTGSKEIRANPVASAAEAGNIKLLRGTWNTDFLDEFEAFPEGPHDDIVDAVSGAISKLTQYEPLGGDTVERAW